MHWVRYGAGARLYDVISFERPVYRVGRREGISLLALTPGDRVLDVGCGTGLNFRLLESAVGEAGSVIGVDASASMLQQAQERVRRHGWDRVQTVCGDAAAIPPGPLFTPGSFDAAIFTYSLSVIDDSASAWSWALSMVRPGGRVAVVDLDLPSDGWAVLRPLARLACWSGGSHYQRDVWRWATRDLVDVTGSDPWGGHVRVRVGTRPEREDRPLPCGFPRM